MTTPHRATPEQWAAVEEYAKDLNAGPACLLELRARVEALEAQYETQRLATLSWGKGVDNHARWIDDHLNRIMALEAGQMICSGHESPLVERVGQVLDAEPWNVPDAMREVAEWLAQNGWGDASDALMRQANR